MKPHVPFGTAVPAVVTAAVLALSCSRAPSQEAFSTPDDAARALITAAKSGRIEPVVTLFGPDGRALIDTSDSTIAARNAQTFSAAAAERWRLTDAGADQKVLVIGNEDWPFPVPITRTSRGWIFDAAAGKEEVLARRIGRNELAAIRLARTYVLAQHVYAAHGHDGEPAGIYARAFHSDPGKRNGLYWPAGEGVKRSPLGDLVATAEWKGQPVPGAAQPPSPFHGYYFRILTAQGAHAPGGAQDYVKNGRMSGGFALVAWPAEYDATGVMTFVVNQTGEVWEKDLGPDTAAAAAAMTLYDPDGSWTAVPR